MGRFLQEDGDVVGFSVDDDREITERTIVDFQTGRGNKEYEKRSRRQQVSPRIVNKVGEAEPLVEDGAAGSAEVMRPAGSTSALPQMSLEPCMRKKTGRTSKAVGPSRGCRDASPRPRSLVLEGSTSKQAKAIETTEPRRSFEEAIVDLPDHAAEEDVWQRVQAVNGAGQLISLVTFQR